MLIIENDTSFLVHLIFDIKENLKSSSVSKKKLYSNEKIALECVRSLFQLLTAVPETKGTVNDTSLEMW